MTSTLNVQDRRQATLDRLGQTGGKHHQRRSSAARKKRASAKSARASETLAPPPAVSYTHLTLPTTPYV